MSRLRYKNVQTDTSQTRYRLFQYHHTQCNLHSRSHMYNKYRQILQPRTTHFHHNLIVPVTIVKNKTRKYNTIKYSPKWHSTSGIERCNGQRQHRRVFRQSEHAIKQAADAVATDEFNQLTRLLRSACNKPSHLLLTIDRKTMHIILNHQVTAVQYLVYETGMFQMHLLGRSLLIFLP